MNLYTLSRCPVCRQRASSALGCCQHCANCLFRPVLKPNLVYLGRYEGALERAVRALKFHGATRLARLFAEQLALLVTTSGWQLDAVSPIPLHWRRYLKRGYNQADLIAKPLAGQLQLPRERALERVRFTKQQARLTKKARTANVAGAFYSSPVVGKRVLLVDDVITSGATVAAARETLLKAGARSVKFACVARA